MVLQSLTHPQPTKSVTSLPTESPQQLRMNQVCFFGERWWRYSCCIVRLSFSFQLVDCCYIIYHHIIVIFLVFVTKNYMFFSILGFSTRIWCLYARTHNQDSTISLHIHDTSVLLNAICCWTQFLDSLLYSFYTHVQGYGCHRNRAYINWVFEADLPSTRCSNSLHKRLLYSPVCFDFKIDKEILILWICSVMHIC